METFKIIMRGIMIILLLVNIQRAYRNEEHNSFMGWMSALLFYTLYLID